MTEGVICCSARGQVGTIHTTGSKIAKHGGDNPGDRGVPLIVYAPGIVQPGQFSDNGGPIAAQRRGADSLG
jgi:hypothetical protein